MRSDLGIFEAKVNKYDNVYNFTSNEFSALVSFAYNIGAGGLIAGTDTWEYWKSCEITNSFFPTRDATWENGAMENVSFDCNYKNNGDSIWIQSGGYDDTPSNITFPTTETLT